MNIDALGVDPLALAAAVPVFVLAGLVKGVVGLGLPTLAMALLAWIVDPARAAAWLLVPSLVTNLWQLQPWSRLGPLALRHAGLLAGIVAATLGTAAAWGAPSGRGSAGLLGLALLAYAAWGLAGAAPRIGEGARAGVGLAAGLLTGVLTAMTGVFVMPAVPYLQATEADRDALVQMMGLSFTVSTLALGAGLALDGRLAPVSTLHSLLLLPPALIGMALGQRLRQRLSPVTFRRCFLLGLGALGAYLAVDAGLG